MTTRFAAALLLVASTVAGAAPADDEAAVRANVAALAKAIVAVDRPVLERLTWPELTYGHGSGRLEGKQEFVETLVTKRNIITSIDDSGVTVLIAGDTAIVRCHSIYGVMTTGTFVRADLRLLMTWQKRGGEWKLLARQAFKV